MIGLDTNILVRYLTQDDENQFRRVLKLLSTKGSLFYLSDLVLVETFWALKSIYDWDPNEIADVLGNLTSVHNLIFENEARLLASLRAVRLGADLADELIVRAASSKGVKKIATFDKGMIRRHTPFAFEPA